MMQVLSDALDGPGAVGRLGSLACSLAMSLWLLIACGGFDAHAHGDADHDHGPPAAAAAGSLPRLAVKSEAYELVSVLDGERLTIYLDRFEDNAPVTDAKITVTIDGESAAAEPAAGNTFVVSSKRFGGHGSVELIFDIKAPEVDDLMIGTLMLPNRPATDAASNPMSWPARAWSALRHAGEDHLALVGLMLLVGVALGLLLRRSRPWRVAAVLLLVLPLIERPAHAHEGHDHGSDSKALAAPGDTARRLPSGQLFVPKPMQRILDVRTVVAKPETAAKAVVLVGRVIANPNRSGVVQSIQGGRVIAPEQGLPRLGQPVAKGDVLAMVEHAIPAADRTTISERSGEIEQLIAIAEGRLARLRPLAERSVVPQSQITDAETELEGLKRRRDVIRNTRIAPEVLRAPIDGVVAASRVVAGQVVQAQDLLFQIVDPASLWIEALDYGEIDPATLKEATAVGSKPMTLAFQGWSRALQQQATILHFAIVDPPPSIRVGQPVTVTAKRSDSVTGVIISREAVVRGGNGEMIVWRHVEPEQFEARPVRIEPFDAASVLIAAGVESGDRIVTRGAELINQIR
jgi:membrane fusion protein, heavy metal efflux system